MKKRLTAIFLTAIMALSLTGPVEAAETGFYDVASTAWYAESVDYCQKHGLMAGTGDGNFSPDMVMNRATLVTVLYRMSDSPKGDATTFDDVSAEAWYTDAVSWAVREGIAGGYGDGRFGPDDPITREQAAVMLWRFAGMPDALRQNEFSDRDAADPYVCTAIDWVSSVGIMNGVEKNRFAPGDSLTRAQAASVLMRYDGGYMAGADKLSTLSAIDVMCAPSGIAAVKNGEILITDTYHKLIWHVRLGAGTVYAGGETVAGLYGEPLGGYNDEAPLTSYFREPWAVAPFLDGWAVSDTSNNAVRLVRVSDVQTLNGKSNEKLVIAEMGVVFNEPTGLAADDRGNLYISDTGNGAVRQITPKGVVSTVAKDLNRPMGLCWQDGTLYIAETGANRIKKLQNGQMTTVAGSGEAGLADGSAMLATFSAPQGVTAGTDGTVYVADTCNGAVRMVRDGKVTTLAVRDMTQTQGGLTSPRGLLLSGNSLYICDGFARKIFVLRL